MDIITLDFLEKSTTADESGPCKRPRQYSGPRRHRIASGANGLKNSQWLWRLKNCKGLQEKKKEMERVVQPCQQRLHSPLWCSSNSCPKTEGIDWSRGPIRRHRCSLEEYLMPSTWWSGHRLLCWSTAVTQRWMPRIRISTKGRLNRQTKLPFPHVRYLPIINFIIEVIKASYIPVTSGLECVDRAVLEMNRHAKK